MRRLVFVVFFYSGAATIPPLLAQQQQFSLLRLTAVDGLPQSQVNMVVEDADGYLWIGTNGGGLARFDGKEFKVYTTRDGLQSNIIQFLKIDSQNNLWIINPRGITKFDGLDFKIFLPDALASKFSVRRVFEVNDTLFFVNGQRALAKIHNDSVYYWNKPVRKDKLVLYTHLMPDKAICLYLNDSSFVVKSNKGETVMSHAGVFNQAYSMFNYQDKLWIKTERGYFSMDAQAGRFVHEELDISNVIIQYDTLNKFFWTHYKDNMLKEYWVDGKHRADTVLKNVTVTQILTDSEGNTWMGSVGNGLYKYFVQDFDRCASEKLGSVMSIAKGTDGASWIGTLNHGLWMIKGGKTRNFAVGMPSDNGVNAIKVSKDGTVWVASNGGLGRYDAANDRMKFYTREDGISSTYLNDLDIDDRGNVWYATNSGGLGYFTGTRFVNFTTQDGLYGLNITTVCYSPRHKTVFAGNEFGLNAVSDGIVKKVPLPEFSNTTINSIHNFRDSLIVIGSAGAGIMVYNPSGNFRKVIDSRDGLPSDFIYFAAPDQEGLLWVGTEQGVTRLKLSDALELEQNLNYGFENGLSSVETNRNAFYLGDEKYFGLIDGVYQYNELPRYGWHSFQLHLTDVQIFYGQFSSRSYADSAYSFFHIPVNPVLPSDKNHITFRFNRVDKRYPKSVKFKYYMSNFDKTWSQPSTFGMCTYSNLPPGHYVLNVVATNVQGSWDQIPLRYAFTVKAPFYQLAWFQVLAAAAVIGIVVLYFYLRVRKRVNRMLEVERIRNQEQESLRKEIARDFHDEMGNQLTRIINYVSLLKISQNGNASPLYDKVEDSAKYLYSGTRDFIWSIDPGNDELSKLFIHIRDFGEKLFEEKEINFRANNHVKVTTSIPYGFSREANLIFKEAMTNTFNHSGAKNVTFTLKSSGSGFEMSLEDDGIGFDLNNLEHPNGLNNMKSRADRMNCVFSLESEVGKGTLLKITIPTNIKNEIV